MVLSGAIWPVVYRGPRWLGLACVFAMLALVGVLAGVIATGVISVVAPRFRRGSWTGLDTRSGAMEAVLFLVASLVVFWVAASRFVAS